MEDTFRMSTASTNQPPHCVLCRPGPLLVRRTAVKELIKAGMPVNPILYLGNYFMRMATEPPVYEHTEEAKKLMADRGWDQGYVVFGHGPSESTVKLLTTVCLVKGTDFKHVDVSFDDTVLGEEDKMGVKSEAFKLLTAGVSKMPALAIDGVMYYESELICRKLAVDTGAPSEVIELIDLSIASSERVSGRRALPAPRSASARAPPSSAGRRRARAWPSCPGR